MAKRKPAVPTDLAFQDDAALMGAPEQRNALLDEIARGGGKWVRTNVIYGKTAGGRDLSGLDALVDAAKSRGLKVQATLMGTPRYMASSETDALSYKRPDPKVMAAFAHAVASHEKGRVGRYSIWNEPDLGVFLGGPGKGRPLAYRRLYQAGQKAVQGVDKGNEVLLGEMSPYGAIGFLKSVLRRGDRPLTTSGYAVHPYEVPNAQAPISNLAPLKRVLAGEAHAKRLLTRAGHQAPLYLTEFGYQRPGVSGGPGDVQIPVAQRRGKLVNASRLAAEAGAREMLYYQLAASPRSAAPSSYGGSAGGVWDTTLAPEGGLEGLVRDLVRARPRARSR